MQALSQLSYTPFKRFSTACNLYRFVFGVALFKRETDYRTEFKVIARG